jgi:hypothetical protein
MKGVLLGLMDSKARKKRLRVDEAADYISLHRYVGNLTQRYTGLPGHNKLD